MSNAQIPRDHGGNLDAAIKRYGGTKSEWLDLSTGINPVPYPVGDLDAEAWARLPDSGAEERLSAAARAFWNVPDGATLVPAPGASALIARMPALFDAGTVFISKPTYNEHEAAFRAGGWPISESPDAADTHIYVHPNNPTGRLFDDELIRAAPHMIVDESFCDTVPDASHVAHAERDGVVILKSFGKFWGLAGLRLGFAILSHERAARLRDLIGPWPVAGPALEIGARALSDTEWAGATRARLQNDADRLDALMCNAGASVVGGTTLFRLYELDNAEAWQVRLAAHHIWSRTFPYSESFLRLGLPAPERWEQLEAAL